MFTETPYFAPFVGSFLGSTLALFTGLMFNPRPSLPYDCEREIQRITFKVRHPWKSRMRRLFAR